MGFAHEYATAIVRRGRYPMEPADWVPDWADRPRKGKHFPAAPAFPLPEGPPQPDTATVDRGLHGPGGSDGFTLPLLAGMLRDSYGLTGRRLAVQANSDLATLPLHTQANWSRGTASGGGLYPIGIHLVTGPGGPLAPGVHYYDTQHHALRRLLTGDVTATMRSGVGQPAAGQGDFLVLTVRFWQNAFKYNSFSYHVVTMDTGALLQTWRTWAHARGLALNPAFWFDERRVGDLLGLTEQEEGVFAVVPLRRAGGGTPSDGPDAPGAAPDRTPTDRTAAGQTRPGQLPSGQLPGNQAPGDQSSTGGTPADRTPADRTPADRTPADRTPPDGMPAPRVRHRDQERSHRLSTFETVLRMHAATLEGAAQRPAPGTLDAALALPVPPGGQRTGLPEPRRLAMGVREALRTRRSSFGRFQAGSGVSAGELATVLAAADAAGGLGSDVETPGAQPLTRLYVFVSHVAGVEPGTYVYDRADRSLRLLKAGAPGAFLQRNYFLANYNLEQAAAVIVPAARTHAVLDAVGDRGYRLVNAVVGGISQAVYTAAAAAGLACGVALGFDAISYTEELGLDRTGELPLLTMMIGHERPRPADFRSEIV